nr:hypothetical protein [Veillonella sp.]
MGGDCYEYVQSVISHDILWDTRSGHYSGSKVTILWA